MNYCEPLERIVDEVDVDCILVAGRLNLLDQQADPFALTGTVPSGTWPYWSAACLPLMYW